VAWRWWIALSMVMGSKGDVLAGPFAPPFEAEVVAGDEALRTVLVFAADGMGKVGTVKNDSCQGERGLKLNFHP
jgi:hypothetical protein